MIKQFFKKIFESDRDLVSDKRAKFRFDVKYIEELKLVSNSSQYKLKEVSLDGFSFYHNKPLELIEVTNAFLGQITLKDYEVPIGFEVINTSGDLCGCKVTSGKDQYNRFVKDTLGPFLSSYTD